MNIIEKEGLVTLLMKHNALIKALLDDNERLTKEGHCFLDTFQVREFEKVISENQQIINCLYVDR